jgi:tetratricopeptide (TPR) repeat protein
MPNPAVTDSLAWSLRDQGRVLFVFRSVKQLRGKLHPEVWPLFCLQLERQYGAGPDWPALRRQAQGWLDAAPQSQRKEPSDELDDCVQAAFTLPAGLRSRLFARLRQSWPEEIDLYNSEGLSYLLECRWTRAIPFLFEAYQQGDASVRTRAAFNLGMASRGQRNFEAALAYFQECLKQEPEDGLRASVQLGYQLHHLGRIEQALQHFSTMLDEPWPESHFEMACLEYKRGRAWQDHWKEGLARNAHFAQTLSRRCRPSSEWAQSPDSLALAQDYSYWQRSLWPLKLRRG